MGTDNMILFSRFVLIIFLSLHQSDAATCRSSFLQHGSLCYGLMNNYLSWHDAQNTCKIFGAHLAEPKSEIENMILKGMYASSGEAYVWLGGHDMITEGYWEWATGGS